MAISVLEANLKDALSDPARAAGVYDLLASARQRPDVAVFPEAYEVGREGLLDGFEAGVKQLGYTAVRHNYEDTDDRLDAHGWMILAMGKLVVGQPDILHLGKNEEERSQGIGRVAVRLGLRDPKSGSEFDLFAAHFDDRSQADNVEQARSLLAFTDPERPTGVVADANSGRPRGLLRPLLRSLGWIARRLPKVEPGTSKPANLRSVEGIKWGFKRGCSVADRLGQMAGGKTVAVLEQAGFVDDDPQQRPTMSNKLPLIKLDHLFARNARVKTGKPVKNRITDHRFLKGVYTVGSAKAGTTGSST